MAVAATDGSARFGVHNNDAAVSETRGQVATVRGEIHRVDKRGIEKLPKIKLQSGLGAGGKRWIHS